MSRDSSRIISVIVPGPKYYIIHNVQIHIVIRAAAILFLPITFDFENCFTYRVKI